MNEPKDLDEIDIFFPTAPCSFCEESIKELWRIENRRGEIMAGEYCSEGCCSKDAWGPIYRNSNFVQISNAEVRHGQTTPPRHTIKLSNHMETYPDPKSKEVTPTQGESAVVHPPIVRLGDYVHAAKYGDYDPNDPWRIGFVVRIIETWKPHPVLATEIRRTYVIGEQDGTWDDFREYNFAKQITAEEGRAILEMNYKTEGPAENATSNRIESNE